jgi:hypothetical protein
MNCWCCVRTHALQIIIHYHTREKPYLADYLFIKIIKRKNVHINQFIPHSKPDSGDGTRPTARYGRSIQKLPDWADNEIYADNNKHSFRSNMKGYGGKTH